MRLVQAVSVQGDIRDASSCLMTLSLSIETIKGGYSTKMIEKKYHRAGVQDAVYSTAVR